MKIGKALVVEPIDPIGSLEKPRMAADLFRPCWDGEPADLEAPEDLPPEAVRFSLVPRLRLGMTSWRLCRPNHLLLYQAAEPPRLGTGVEPRHQIKRGKYSMSVVKERIVEVIQNQPDDATYEEILKELAFGKMIEQGLSDSRKGETISNEEMKCRISAWQK